MKPQSSYYHPELDVLRFWAFAQVLWFHLAERYIKGHGMLSHHSLVSNAIEASVKVGALGVDLFFCLSSFLITVLLLREYDVAGTLNVKQFWIRRILRIWPLYFFFLALTIFVLPLFGGFGDFNHFYAAAYALLCGNWACVFYGAPLSPAAPLWSVSVEEQFYLLWPLLICLLSPRRLVPLAFLGLLLASVTRVVLVATGAIHTEHPVIWMNTLTQIDPIAIGALCAVLARRKAWEPSGLTRLGLAAFGLIVPMVILAVCGPDNCFGGRACILFYPVVAICCACQLGAVYLHKSVPMPRFLVYLGRISYGLYVFHTLAIALANRVPSFGGAGGMAKLMNAVVLFGVAPALTVIMAALSYRFLEQPFLRLKEKFTTVHSAPIQLSATGVGGEGELTPSSAKVPETEGNQG